MFLTRTEYDRGVNTFSPEGRLFQVEYAIEAIKVFLLLLLLSYGSNCCSFCLAEEDVGSTAIGIKTSEGVVLAVEKRITSPLLVLFFSVQLISAEQVDKLIENAFLPGWDLSAEKQNKTELELQFSIKINKALASVASLLILRRAEAHASPLLKDLPCLASPTVFYALNMDLVTSVIQNADSVAMSRKRHDTLITEQIAVVAA
ncbi:hypothetical protein Cgig2_012558 [Carnegiea gigantea]|uniref:Proteasome alpha-type subunits domain-containing protein n=1 Tax=Carnegiea gigantea TaxID=171969 RepID=A0A9Q1K2Y5_9CARY|nr:hypothetical protein Cgig2_012558 [Carnegiea gigantea]